MVPDHELPVGAAPGTRPKDSTTVGKATNSNFKEETMNVQYLLELADFLEKKPDEAVDMSTWSRYESNAPCKTAACIAGWATIRAEEKAVVDGSYEEVFRNLAGLTDKQATHLCYTIFWPHKYVDLYNEVGSRKAAVQLLRDVANGVTILAQ